MEGRGTRDGAILLFKKLAKNSHYSMHKNSRYETSSAAVLNLRSQSEKFFVRENNKKNNNRNVGGWKSL